MSASGKDEKRSTTSLYSFDSHKKTSTPSSIGAETSTIQQPSEYHSMSSMYTTAGNSSNNYNMAYSTAGYGGDYNMTYSSVTGGTSGIGQGINTYANVNTGQDSQYYSPTSAQDGSSAYEYASYQPAGVNYQNGVGLQQDEGIQSWDHLFGNQSTGTSGIGSGGDYNTNNLSQSVSGTDLTSSAGGHQQNTTSYSEYGGDIQQGGLQYGGAAEEVGIEQDYATIVRTRHLYYDPNPQMIHRKQPSEPVTYKQNVMIRFLQPPPIPPPGPLIVREVRPPQPPPPPPVVIRQRPPPVQTPPPLILRERPPPIPAAMTATVVTRTLPSIPPPPRSVILEKLPPLPPKPRDIIIERWIPYESMHKRKVIVQKAEAEKPYPAPRNIIIAYESVQARVVRQFQKLGVTPEDPKAYTARYGSSLLDPQRLVTEARQYGVVEDIVNIERRATAATSANSFQTGTFDGEYYGGLQGSSSGFEVGAQYENSQSYNYGSSDVVGQDLNFGGITNYTTSSAQEYQSEATVGANSASPYLTGDQHFSSIHYGNGAAGTTSRNFIAHVSSDQGLRTGDFYGGGDGGSIDYSEELKRYGFDDSGAALQNI
ncbi:unnamed protein product [Didymodactylos carnosus]|uniref:Uncharacterized protein n=1 Tax=Didymodactylos carnosus TaxID=1234261 RepID=A0A815IQE7_9BILA|nr:unnamed protein product [Didymodactylos carnosus]CAF4258867.1 unnamed protein product [Didymodactylos carnosus]